MTLQGTLDSLLPIATDADVYERMVDASGRGALHRYYVIEDGNHVDANYDAWPDRLRPILPCFRQAFLALEGWVERGARPPGSQLVPDPHAGDVVNTCTLAKGPDVAGPGPAPAPAAAASGAPRDTAARAHPRGLTLRARRHGRALEVRGRLLLPAGLTAPQACGSGVVSLTVKHAARTVSARVTRLRADCGYAVRIRFTRGIPRRLRVRARFHGNRALYEI